MTTTVTGGGKGEGDEVLSAAIIITRLFYMKGGVGTWGNFESSPFPLGPVDAFYYTGPDVIT